MRISSYGLGLTAALVMWAAEPSEQRTSQALDLVLAGKYEAFYEQFSPKMKKALTLENYSAQVGQLLSKLGKPESQDPPKVRQAGDTVTVTIPLHWPQANLNFIVSWNAAGEIQGTWFRPGDPKYQTAPYTKLDAFSSRDITVGSDQWKLPGTLTVPNGKGPWPAVVLVHGSGPNSRDECVGGACVFRDLAEGLSSRGVAVLRYDKRTMVYPKECAADKDFTMTRETVDDGVRAAELLRKQDGIDPRRVFALGHSQGGYMMPRIMQADPNMAGVIILAGNVRPLEELIVEQYEYILSLEGELTPENKAKLEAIRKNPWSPYPALPPPIRTT